MANKNFVNFLSEKDYDDLKYLWNEYANDKDFEAYIYDSVEDFADNDGDEYQYYINEVMK